VGKTKEKRGRGQPVKRNSPTVRVCITLPVDLVRDLDAEVRRREADGQPANRSDLIVELLQQSLGAEY
jgi:metal-responsive CopG/Arc/MetJ family transcriptional regulator